MEQGFLWAPVSATASELLEPVLEEVLALGAVEV